MYFKQLPFQHLNTTQKQKRSLSELNLEVSEVFNFLNFQLR